MLAAVLLAAGSAVVWAPSVWAASLDKSACNDLNQEFAGMLATGLRGDMERGPQWAKDNLGPEKLQDMRHLIELEEQLEFRCGVGHARIVTKTPAAPEKKIESKMAPSEPQKEPQPIKASEKVPPALKPTLASTSTEKLPPPPLKPTLASTTTDKVPPVAPTSAAPPPLKAAPVTTTPKSTAAVAPKVAAKTASSTPAALPPTAAAKKSSRREPVSAYVSPTEVNPDFVTRFGDSR